MKITKAAAGLPGFPYSLFILAVTFGKPVSFCTCFSPSTEIEARNINYIPEMLPTANELSPWCAPTEPGTERALLGISTLMFRQSLLYPYPPWIYSPTVSLGCF